MGVSDVEDGVRHPGIVLFVQFQIGERITIVSIESRRNQDQGRLVRIKAGKNLFVQGFPEFDASLARSKRDVNDLAVSTRFRWCASARIARHLMCGCKKSAWIIPKKVAGAVSVVDVEIDDRQALKSMEIQGMFCGNGHVSKNAEPHGSGGFGMVARRAYCTERVFSTFPE